MYRGMSIKSYRKKRALTGNEAIAIAVHQVGVDRIPIYPITPQTEIGELLSSLEKDKVIELESEHSVASYALGVSLAGGRVFTATSSQGLAYMAECLPFIAGSRRPVVMAVVSRTLATPWNLGGDFSDIFFVRDCGWLISICKDAQEAYDSIIQGFRIAETINIPIMIGIRGFVVSHSKERVEVNSDKEVKEFVGKFTTKLSLNPNNPYVFCGQALFENYKKFICSLDDDIASSTKVIKEVAKAYSKRFKRKVCPLFEVENEEREIFLLSYGDVADTIREIAERKKYGFARIKWFRPFPIKELQKCLKEKMVIVIDNSFSLGGKGIIFTELRGNLSEIKLWKNIVCGIGGVSLTKAKIEKGIRKILNSKKEILFM